jgi:hypothetical protein
VFLARFAATTRLQVEGELRDLLDAMTGACFIVFESFVVGLPEGCCERARAAI